ncbi:hypothetical protein EXN66_Car013698 [Channa argus]|uniref:Uncharacterized protein n=1 Tax=Channa argus TaxID=215402 RepID=A0A6G1Q681_CHAAH|nr:hypothetical protein EXN66_Car013698 [Channa argus]
MSGWLGFCPLGGREAFYYCDNTSGSAFRHQRWIGQGRKQLLSCSVLVNT